MDEGILWDEERSRNRGSKCWVGLKKIIVYLLVANQGVEEKTEVREGTWWCK